MKKILIAAMFVCVIFTSNCYGGHERARCDCECPCNNTSFYRGQKVWDVVSGEGKVKSINQNSINPFPIYVAFPGGAVRVYAMDGKHFETDLLPSLYPYKVKIIEDK
jgi:hypothetical protein